MKVLIIEDEEPAQEELERLLTKNFPNVEIVDKLALVKESVEWLRKNTADLIFLDIHLADGNGFEIFKQTEIQTPVIFTTAYDQYAIDAFKVNGIGYLLKPIVESELCAALKKFDYLDKYKLKSIIESLTTPREFKSRIAVTKGDRIEFILVKDIAYIFAEERLTFIMTKEGKKYEVNHTIESLISQLDPKKFFRITRGVISSIDSIKRISRHFNGRLLITLSPEFNENLYVSRARVPEFMNWLDDK